MCFLHPFGFCWAVVSRRSRPPVSEDRAPTLRLRCHPRIARRKTEAALEKVEEKVSKLADNVEDLVNNVKDLVNLLKVEKVQEKTLADSVKDLVNLLKVILATFAFLTLLVCGTLYVNRG